MSWSSSVPYFAIRILGLQPNCKGMWLNVFRILEIVLWVVIHLIITLKLYWMCVPTKTHWHCVLFKFPVLQYNNKGEAFIYDLGSTHGTFINKRQVLTIPPLDTRYVLLSCNILQHMHACRPLVSASRRLWMVFACWSCLQSLWHIVGSEIELWWLKCPGEG